MSVAKTADVIILMSKYTAVRIHSWSAPPVLPHCKTYAVLTISVDATKSAEQKRLLEIELDAVGIRLNARRPDVVFKQKTAGGVCAARA